MPAALVSAMTFNRTHRFVRSVYRYWKHKGKITAGQAEALASFGSKKIVSGE
jgi:hypothetical protein